MDSKYNSRTFPYYRQSHQNDCGPTCLKMIAEFYGKSFHPAQMHNIGNIIEKGSSLFELRETAEKIGLRATAYKISLDDIDSDDLPAILLWESQHFVVLFEIVSGVYRLADPARGIINLHKSEFVQTWQYELRQQKQLGVILTFSSS